MRVFHENPVYSLNSHLLTLKVHNHSMYVFEAVFVIHLNIFSLIDKQCGPRSVISGSTLFASSLEFHGIDTLNNYQSFANKT